MSMSNDELQNLEKAGRFRKQVDKNKEKVMDMLKMNGPEYLPIEAGKAGLVDDEPSLKRRKLEIEDLAEKADIIKRARETQYELSMGRALLERKQSEFFEKQATPFQKTIKDPNDPDYMKPIGQVIRDTAEENKRQLDAINANLERNGFSDDKILALQGSIASIVDAVDISDDLNDIKNLIANVCERIEKIPAFKDDRAVIESSIGKGLLPDIDFGDDISSKPIEYAGPPLPISEPPPDTPVMPETPAPAIPPMVKAKSTGKTPPAGPPPEKGRRAIRLKEGKAETVEGKDDGPVAWDSQKFANEFSNWLSKVDDKWSSKITLISGGKFPQKGLKTFLTNFAEKNRLVPLSEDEIDSYADIAIKRLEQTGSSGFAKRKMLIEGNKQEGRGFNESLQQYMSSGKTIDDVARLRNNLRKGITGKGIGLRLPEDIEMFGKKLKKNFTGKGGITTEIHKDFLKKNYKVGKGVNYSKMKPEQLMKNLTLNIASMQAGNTGVKDQINSIIDQMLDRGIIKKSEHKKLWYQYVD